MGFSFGGLGIVFANKHLADWSWSFLSGHAGIQIRSMLFATVTFLLLILLAYLTNPSESSFRAYLTEQSFRQHLSRLDDTSDDDPERLARRKPSPHRKSSSSNTPVLFTNRASVSLRTPKHDFHSFGLLTVAAVIPAGSGGKGNDDKGNNNVMLWDTWFIGAFGRWWKCGVIDQRWYDSVNGGEGGGRGGGASKDEEVCRSGIFDVKVNDRDRFAGLPYATSPPPPRSPPRLRQRERSNHLPARSSTPPPLPKSASLPLHTPRHSNSNSDYRPLTIQTPPPPLLQHQPVSSPVSAPSPDASPVIAHILAQINSTKSAVSDVRSQLDDFQASAHQQHLALQSDLDGQREKKRTEEGAKGEVRGRMKGLEETKRVKEAGKREVERRLKVAQGKRDGAVSRIGELEKQIQGLNERLIEDRQSTEANHLEWQAKEQSFNEAVAGKRGEIKVAEEAVALLNGRARELEERIAGERERLLRAREEAEIRKQDRRFIPLHVINNEVQPEMVPWPPIVCGSGEEGGGNEVVGQAMEVSEDKGNNLPARNSPRPKKLSLTGISNFGQPATASTDTTNQRALRAKGYSIFDDDIASLAQLQQPPPAFSPFDADVPSPPGLNGSHNNGNGNGDLATPNSSSSLIPSSLINSLESGGGNDNVYEAYWTAAANNNGSAVSHHHRNGLTTTTSPTSFAHGHHHHGGEDYDPFEVRMPPRERLSSDPVHAPRPSLPMRNTSDPVAESHRAEAGDASAKSGGPRRWFSMVPKDKSSKKGLNPDAKVFNLVKRNATSPTPPTTFAAPFVGLGFGPFGSGPPAHAHGLPPTRPASAIAPLFSTMNIQRAFAPSKEEREALQRALGGSANTSLERLPSLSDVGSIPTSPAHTHAVATSHAHTPTKVPGLEPNSSYGGSSLSHPHGPARPWWAGLPHVRRSSNFSPWDDDEPLDNKHAREGSGSSNGTSSNGKERA